MCLMEILTILPHLEKWGVTGHYSCNGCYLFTQSATDRLQFAAQISVFWLIPQIQYYYYYYYYYYYNDHFCGVKFPNTSWQQKQDSDTDAVILKFEAEELYTCRITMFLNGTLSDESLTVN